MSRGVTLDAPAQILPAGTRLRLLRDRILVKPLDWEPSQIITVVRHGRPLRGVVAAVGPGRYFRRYKPHATDPNKRTFTDGKHFIPTEIKPGDVIELGGLNAYDGQGYNFPQVVIGTERFLICQEQDVAFVHDAASTTVAVHDMDVAKKHGVSGQSGALMDGARSDCHASQVSA